MEEEFVKALEENQNVIHKVCRIYTSDREAHNDLFQEITLQLWKSYSRFRGDAKFSTWMYRVALNTAISLYRKGKKQRQQPIDFYEFRLKNEEYDDTAEQQLKLMYAAIRALNDIDKALIFMYLEEKEYSEIAEILGISEVNVRVRMNRVKNKLKELLNP